MSHCSTRILILSVALFLVIASPAGAEPWTVIASGTTSNLVGVTMVAQNYGFISGAGGTLLRTTDGGMTWYQQRLVSGFHQTMNCAAMTDSDSFAMAVGENGEAVYRYPYYTSWSPFSQVVDSLYGVCAKVDSVPTFFSVGTHGYMAEYQFHTGAVTVYDEWGNPYDSTVYYTTSRDLAPVTGVTLRAVYFSLSDGYAVGDSGIVITSKDYGTTWQRKSVNPAIALRSLTWIERDKLLAVGDHGNMWLTTNGGAVWTNVAPEGLTEDLHGVSFADIHNGVAVGDDGLILQTNDGGMTWMRQGVNTLENLRGVHCFEASGESNWLAVGDNGTLVQTLYGGAAAVTMLTDKSSIDFGDVTVGTRLIDNFTFENTSASGYLTVQVSSNDPLVVVSPSQLILEAQATGKIKVTFSPTDTARTAAQVFVSTDTSWRIDTFHVAGRGVAAIARVTVDSVVFDSAVAGSRVQFDVQDIGNVPLTARVAFVSDTNFAVTCDTIAVSEDNLHVHVAVLHTLYQDVGAYLVLQTNDYKNPLDTVAIMAYGVPLLGVNESSMPNSASAVCYPNPLPVGTVGTIHFADGVAPGAVLRVVDARGATVEEVRVAAGNDRTMSLSLPNVSPGAYYLQIASRDAVRYVGAVVVR